MDKRSLVGYSPSGYRESNTTECSPAQREVFKYDLKKWVLSSTSLFLNRHLALKPLHSTIDTAFRTLVKTGLESGNPG